jgi:hypothetical protein
MNDKEPSMSEMVESLAKSLVNEGKEIVKGTLRVTDKEREARLDICRGCNFFKINSHVCGKCGCFMKLKTSMVCWMSNWQVVSV